MLHSSIDVGSRSEIELANISMLVMKRQLVGGGHSDWSSDGVSVMLPDQTSLTGSNSVDEDVVSVSFTKYNNLGQMMNDKSNSIRYWVLNILLYRHLMMVFTV